jgi:hypothetical protein
VSESEEEEVEEETREIVYTKASEECCIDYWTERVDTFPESGEACMAICHERGFWASNYKHGYCECSGHPQGSYCDRNDGTWGCEFWMADFLRETAAS